MRPAVKSRHETHNCCLTLKAVAVQITDFAFVVAGIIVVLNLLSILIFKVAQLTCCATVSSRQS